MNTKKWIAVILIILLIIGGLMYYFYKKGLLELPLTQAQKDSIERKEARFREILGLPPKPPKESRFTPNIKETRFTINDNDIYVSYVPGDVSVSSLMN